MRKCKGSVTVFLCLTLTTVMALVGGLFESARAAGQNAEVQTALDSSIESLMSRYRRDVWDHYRIFVLEYENADALANQMQPYLEAYLKEMPYYPIRDGKLSVEEPVKMTDLGGAYFDLEAVSYMKPGMISGLPEIDSLQETAKGVSQAESFGDVTEQIKVSDGKVTRLERAVDKVCRSLREQVSSMEAADDAAGNADAGGFYRNTGKLKDELSRMPDLIAACDRAADELGASLDEVDSRIGEEKENLREDMRSRADEELRAYRSYTDADGERRKQLHAFGDHAAENLVVADAAIERAHEVEEHIEAMEDDDDDDDDEDPRELWRTVLDVTAGYFRDDPGVPGGRDQKKLDLLEKLAGLSSEAVLSLCVPGNVTISDRNLPKNDLPSGLPDASGDEEEGSEITGGLLTRPLFDEYGVRFFRNFCTADPEADFCCEQEYLLAGEDKDKENLRDVILRLLAVRDGMNLFALMTDSEKSAEAMSAAAAIAGSTLVLAPFVTVVYYMILTIWATAESIADIRTLLAGGKVSLIKGTGDFKVSLDALLERGLGVLDSDLTGSDESGMDYQAWIRVFLFLMSRRTLRFRMMDLIQFNIALRNPGFRLDHCAYRITAVYTGKSVIVPLNKKAVREYR